jgi:flagellar protein FlaG
MDVKVSSQGRQDVYNVNNDNSAKGAENTKISTGSTPSSNSTSDSNSQGVTVQQAKKAAEKLDILLEDKNTHIEYEQDDNFKNVMIMKVVDNDTKEVINEIPSKQVLDMVAKFCEMAGILLNKRA